MSYLCKNVNLADLFVAGSGGSSTGYKINGNII